MSKFMGVKKLVSIFVLKFSVVLFVLFCFANHIFGLRFQSGVSMPTCACVVTLVYTVPKMGPNKYEP